MSKNQFYNGTYGISIISSTHIDMVYLKDKEWQCQLIKCDTLLINDVEKLVNSFDINKDDCIKSFNSKSIKARNHYIKENS